MTEIIHITYNEIKDLSELQKFQYFYESNMFKEFTVTRNQAMYCGDVHCQKCPLYRKGKNVKCGSLNSTDFKQLKSTNPELFV